MNPYKKPRVNTVPKTIGTTLDGSNCEEREDVQLEHEPEELEPTVATNFPNCHVDWVIGTFHPLNTCEGEKFRRMCNVNLGKDIVSLVLAEKKATAKATIIQMVRGQYISLTTDGWSSLANESSNIQTGQILYLII